MKLILPLAAIGLAASFAACGQKPEKAAETAAPAAPAASSDKGAMNLPGEAKTAKGTGTVTAVTTDSITIDHVPIPEASWPAMTMTFKASPELAKSVKAGDKVSFDLKLAGGVGELTAIQKQ